jgi:hypothetical protein
MNLSATIFSISELLRGPPVTTAALQRFRFVCDVI